MKGFVIIILLLSPIIGFSQTPIPSIEWQTKSEVTNPYVALLKLQDTNALIVKIAYDSYWGQGTSGSIIVFQNDGKIKRFRVFEPWDSTLKTTVKRIKTKEKRYKNYWAHLDECAQNRKFRIDKSLLDINEKRGDKPDVTLEMSISDGKTYIFEIYQRGNSSKFTIYEPRAYIENGYPGSEERQKLVDLMAGFEALSK